MEIASCRLIAWAVLGLASCGPRAEVLVAGGNQRPRLDLSPASALAGEPLALRVRGARPGGPATVHAQSVLRDDAGEQEPFYSEATFVADASGSVDLATAAPQKGYYGAADLRGLFWSQRPVAHDPKGQAAIAALHLDEAAAIGKNQVVLTLDERGVVEDRKVLTLDVPGPRFLRETVRSDAVVGAFYCEKDAKHRPVVVALGGSEGGLEFADWIGPRLAMRGYAVLGLAYFAPPGNAIAGVSTALNRIPVELVEQARAWLKLRPEADIGRFGLVGFSKGAEFALVIASTYDWITVAVAYAPADYVWQGFQYGGGGNMGASWTRAGRDLPFLPLTGTREEIAKGHQPGGKSYLARVARTNIAAASPDSLAAAAIRVELSHASLMLIGGGDDQLWDSGASVQRLADRLERAAYPRPHEVLIYPEAGHGVAGTGWSPTTADEADPMQEGGTPAANAHAQADSWSRMLEFLKRALHP